MESSQALFQGLKVYEGKNDANKLGFWDGGDEFPNDAFRFTCKGLLPQQILDKPDEQKAHAMLKMLFAGAVLHGSRRVMTIQLWHRCGATTAYMYRDGMGRGIMIA